MSLKPGTRITIPLPDDWHCHLRDGAMLRTVAPFTEAHFGRALIMPNVPAIETPRQALDYQARIYNAAPGLQTLMTLKLTERTTPELIRQARCVVTAAKLYPAGVTTGSHDGIRDLKQLAPVFEAMQRYQIVLCIHGEMPGAFVLDREVAYLDEVRWIVRHFPGLKVVLEHISTQAAVEFVEEASVNVAATITPHHLMLTLDDVIGDGIRPHHFCYPVPKRASDRLALRAAVLRSESNRFFLGTDSAPHTQGAKESACGCAGLFSTPVALAVLAEWFETAFAYDCGPARSELLLTSTMTAFCSNNGALFYGVSPSTVSLVLEKKPWDVPIYYPIDGDNSVISASTKLIPWKAGETLAWQVGD